MKPIFFFFFFCCCTINIQSQNLYQKLNYAFGIGIKTYSSVPGVYEENQIHISHYVNSFLDIHGQLSKSFLAFVPPNFKFLYNDLSLTNLQVGAKFYFDELLYPYLKNKFTPVGRGWLEFPLSFCLITNMGIETHSNDLLGLNFLVGGGLGIEYLFNNQLSIKFQNLFYYVGNGNKSNAYYSFVDAPNALFMYSCFVAISYSVYYVSNRFFRKMNQNSNAIKKGKDKFF